jgi:DnaB-like helicase N terminal domain/AAA domain
VSKSSRKPPQDREAEHTTGSDPPQNLEAEMSVLGAMMLKEANFAEVAAILKAADFCQDVHREIFKAMCDLHARGDPIDAVTVCDSFNGKYSKVIGDDYLLQVCNSAPHAANAVYHARIVREKAIARDLIEAGEDIIKEGYSGLYTADDLVVRLRNRIESIASNNPDHIKPRFALKLIGSETIAAYVEPPPWLIKGVIIAGQPVVLGGPNKTLKTSIDIDMAVSLATATPFLGKFAVPRPVRVGFISGESGQFVIRQNALEMCRTRGIDLDRDENIFWGFNLPQITNDDHLRAVEEIITDNGLEVLKLDPFYFTIDGEAVDMKNMFSIGSILDRFGKLCLSLGCLPVLTHHFVKSRQEPYAPPELNELAYGGISQWMRQWCLVSRREPYDASTGIHRLHWRHGGSFGHSGELSLDIETGVVDEDFQGRKWDVTVISQTERIATEQQDRQALAIERELKRNAEKDAAREHQAREDMGKALDVFEKHPDCPMTARKFREFTGWRDDRCRYILCRLVQDGYLCECQCNVSSGNGAVRPYNGYGLVK